MSQAKFFAVARVNSAFPPLFGIPGGKWSRDWFFCLRSPLLFPTSCWVKGQQTGNKTCSIRVGRVLLPTQFHPCKLPVSAKLQDHGWDVKEQQSGMLLVAQRNQQMRRNEAWEGSRDGMRSVQRWGSTYTRGKTGRKVYCWQNGLTQGIQVPHRYKPADCLCYNIMR